MINSREASTIRKMILMCALFLGVLSAYAGTYTTYTTRYDTSDQALAACNAFASSYSYSNMCNNSGMQWTAGWLSTSGRLSTEPDQSFVTGNFLYCAANYKYFADVDKCVAIEAIPTPIGPRDNGPSCCETGKEQPHVGQPINPATGNMWHRETDYAASEPSSLAIVRTYNSNRLKTAGAPLNLFGANWTHRYDAVLRPIAPFTPNVRTLKCWRRTDTNYVWCEMLNYVPPPIPEAVSITRGDGKQSDFNRQADGSWTSHADNNDRISAIISDDGSKVLEWSYKAGIAKTTERFDANGRLLSITSRTGRTERLTYSDGITNDTSAGRYPMDAPVCPNVQAGAVLPAGRLMCATDDWGRQMQFEYDAKYRVSKMIDPAGSSYLYAYDGITGGCTTGTGTNLYACNANNLTSVTYPDGKIRTYHYNEANRINSGTACSSSVSTGGGYVHLVNTMTGLTDENGARYITWTYDCNGLATSSQLGNGAEIISLRYNAAAGGVTTNYIAWTIGPMGSTSRVEQPFSYQDVGGVQKNTAVGGVCPECGPYASRAYDANGNDTSRTDRFGYQTTFVYDLARNVETSRTEAVGTAQARTISTTWHSTYRLPLTIAEPKRITSYSYDANGNLLEKSVQATSDLTGASGLGASAVGTARTWTYTYNAFGQLLTATGPRTDVADVTSYTYDASNGTLASVTNALGHVTTFSDYDAHGRPHTIRASNGITTSLSYTERGQISTRSVSAGGRSENTSYGYDNAGQLTSVTGPDGTTTSFAYDEAHRLIRVSDTLGNMINYELDISGHRIGEKTQDPSGTLARQITRVYDTQNFLKQVTGGAQ